MHQMHTVLFINIGSLEGTFIINYKNEVGTKKKADDDDENAEDTDPEDYETTTEGEYTGMEEEEDEGVKAIHLTDGTNDTEMSAESKKLNANEILNSEREDVNKIDNSDDDSQIVKDDF